MKQCIAPVGPNAVGGTALKNLVLTWLNTMIKVSMVYLSGYRWYWTDGGRCTGDSAVPPPPQG